MANELNIKAIRKAKGIKQEQLAEAVGVSPQAVSKWESGGMPDTALLPVIADYLGVSIDKLFGREQKDNGFFDQFLRHFSDIPQEERIWAFYDLFRFVGASFCGCDHFNEGLFHFVGEDSYTQVETDQGYFQGRLYKSNPYVLIVPQPENGYESVVPYDEKYTKLFRFLSDPNALKTMYLLQSHNDTFFTAETLVSKLNLSKEAAAQIISDLLDLRFIWKAELHNGVSSEPIYQYKIHCEFISFLYFTQVLLNPPHGFAFQNNCREQPYFTKESV